jgi:D-xylose 1-dehydrogenase (NADP+, D-xylono-1,5-lactone-forming)
MATRILNWGILGTARINRALISPLRISPRNRLLGVASREGSHAGQYAAENDIERSYEGYDALLADPRIDVVYIPLPNHMHVEWAIKAAAAGKHVLCEKPLALSVEDVDRVAAAAEQYGVVIAEAFMYRHHPQTLKVLDLIRSGAIGQFQLVRGGFTFFLNRPGNIRLKPEMGGGSIWDVGCYPISYARVAAGGAAPEEVFGWRVLGQTGVDVSFFGQMRFGRGIHAQFDSGFQSTERMVMEFVGTEGRITLTNAFKPDAKSQLYLRKGSEPAEILHFPDEDLYLGEVEDLYDAAVNGKPQRIPLSDTRHNIATIRALIASAETGAAVRPE